MLSRWWCFVQNFRKNDDIILKMLSKISVFGLVKYKFNPVSSHIHGYPFLRRWITSLLHVIVLFDLWCARFTCFNTDVVDGYVSFSMYGKKPYGKCANWQTILLPEIDIKHETKTIQTYLVRLTWSVLTASTWAQYLPETSRGS